MPRGRHDKACLPDQQKELDAKENAIWVSKLGLASTPWTEDILRVLHSLHGGNEAQIVRTQEKLSDLISSNIDKDDTLTTGLMLHAFGDSYAHTYVKSTKEVNLPDPGFKMKVEQRAAYKPVPGHASLMREELGTDIDRPINRLDFDSKNKSYYGGTFEVYVSKMFKAFKGKDEKRLEPIFQLARTIASESRNARFKNEQRITTDEEIARFRALAQSKYDYTWSYAPESATKLDSTINPKGGTATREEVQRALDKIKNYPTTENDDPFRVIYQPKLPLADWIETPRK